MLLMILQRYVTLSASVDPKDTHLPYLAIYTSSTKSAWGELPIKLRRVIQIEDIISISTESKVSAQGKFTDTIFLSNYYASYHIICVYVTAGKEFIVKYLQRNSTQQELVTQERERLRALSIETGADKRKLCVSPACFLYLKKYDSRSTCMAQ